MDLKLVFVGHVDHGKSTLIGRLLYDTNSLPFEKIEEIRKICEALDKEMELGYVMDHLQEEREQGITIDTAQTFFRSGGRNYVIIDAPGHREFLKNMITGASQAEAAILIIAAEEGLQEQTKRHAYILSMLGLEQVIAVINKMDLVNYSQERFIQVKEDTLNFLEKINIKPSYVIPISAKKGDFVAKKTENMTWYEGPSVLEALNTFNPKKSSKHKPLRFPVQDVYIVDKKRIIVGRIESGTLKVGDDVTVLPSKESSEIKSIEVYGKNPREAEAGQSIGITLKDTLFVERGHMIIQPDSYPVVTQQVKGHIFYMDKEPLHIKERIELKCATQEAACSVDKIKKILDSSTLKELTQDRKVIKEREVAEVIIKTDTPIVIEIFNNIQELGRFVLKRGREVIAGGIVTELDNQAEI